MLWKHLFRVFHVPTGENSVFFTIAMEMPICSDGADFAAMMPISQRRRRRLLPSAVNRQPLMPPTTAAMITQHHYYATDWCSDGTTDRCGNNTPNPASPIPQTHFAQKHRRPLQLRWWRHRRLERRYYGTLLMATDNRQGNIVSFHASDTLYQLVFTVSILCFVAPYELLLACTLASWCRL